MSDFVPNFSQKYKCEICDIKTNNKKDFSKHLNTTKHKNRTNLNVLEHENPSKKFQCKLCHKFYIARNSLWYHEKKCPLLNECEKEKTNTVEVNKDGNEIIELLIKENSDFKNIVFELVKSNSNLQKQMLDVCKNNNNINNTIISNSNNKTFNLHFFLNEQCKDAMNIMDFVNSVTLQLSDLENVEKLGYVEGISKIMIQKLSEMDIYKRPVHCSDAKRDTMYVKDKDKWEKEGTDHALLHKAIKYISKKNSDLLVAWSNKYPSSKNISSNVNDQYMRMIKQSMGGNGEIEDNEDKIIKKLAKMMIIDKI